MRKTFLLATASTLASGLMIAAPAMAQNQSAPQRAPMTAPATGMNSQHSMANRRSKQDTQQLVTDAVATVNRVKSDQHFATLMKQSKGVLIVPNMVKGAVLVGGQGGQGVLIAHKDGRWSGPAFVTLGSISIGAQAGGEAGPVVMLLMTNKALNDFTQHNNLSLNANAGLTVVNYSARGQGSVGKGDIVVWSGTKGAFAGASVSGTDVVTNTADNEAYYDTHGVTTPQILNGKVTNPAASNLRQALAG